MIDLLKQLQDFKQILMNSEHNEEVLYREYEAFRNFISKYNKLENIEKLLASQQMVKHDFAHFFSTLERRYVKSTEFKVSQAVLNDSGRFEFLDVSNETINATNVHVVAESKLIDTEDVKTLIMIGSGPYPETMIFYALNTSVQKIIGIDYDKNAIDSAEKLLAKLKLSHKTSFIHGNAESLDYHNADAVIVGSFVSPKLEILKTVLATSSNKTKILLRIPTKLDKMLYEYISDETLTELNAKIVRRLGQSFDIGDTTILLSKE